MSACCKNSLPAARKSQCRGAALLPCVLLLWVVLMLSTSSLVASRNLRQSAQAHTKAALARQGAEAALHDGQRHLMIIDDPLSSEGSGVVHEFGAITGDSYAYAGSMSSASVPLPLPVYRVDVLSATASGGICRISATGWGAQAGTRMSVQADYAVSACAEAAQTSCVRTVRPLAWRELAND